MPEFREINSELQDINSQFWEELQDTNSESFFSFSFLPQNKNWKKLIVTFYLTFSPRIIILYLAIVSLHLSVSQFFIYIS